MDSCDKHLEVKIPSEGHVLTVNTAYTYTGLNQQRRIITLNTTRGAKIYTTEMSLTGPLSKGRFVKNDLANPESPDSNMKWIFTRILSL